MFILPGAKDMAGLKFALVMFGLIVILTLFPIILGCCEIIPPGCLITLGCTPSLTMLLVRLAPGLALGPELGGCLDVVLAGTIGT